MEETPDRLRLVFARVLGVDVALLTDDSSPETISRWDSLATMRLVAGVEDAFGVELSTREIMSMRTIGLARKVLRGKNVRVD